MATVIRIVAHHLKADIFDIDTARPLSQAGLVSAERSCLINQKNIMKNFLAAACLFSFICLSFAARAQEISVDAPPVQEVEIRQIKDPDIMPYSKVYEYMKKFDTIEPNDKIYLRFVVSPKGDARISDLKLTVEEGVNNLPVEIEPDGTSHFPISEAAYAAKSSIYTNQKAGRYKFNYSPGIVVPETTSFRYRDVMDGVKQSSAMMKKFWFFLFPSFVGASLRYPEVQGQYLVIHSQKGDQKVDIDLSRKVIALELDAALYDENPMVTVSEKPFKILPFNVRPSK